MQSTPESTSGEGQEGRIGYWGVVAIGIGGMVGGGIFAVLGLAVELAGGGTWVAFAIAGAVALLTSYSYARLAVTFPSEGGTVEFLNQAFGPELFSGGLNVLLWISYVVMLSLYAHAFGSYAASFLPASSQVFWHHFFMSGIVVLLTLLNAAGATVVGELETWIVAAKVAILLFFVVAGVGSLDPSRLAVSTWSPPLSLVAGGMIIFLAYEGFELIANTAADVRHPTRTLPRALFSAVGFVIFLYVAVAVVTVGNLPLDQIAKAQDYVLAAAAKPFLGEAGFTLIALAALLSTGSAINATLYGAARLSYVIAKERELPPFLERKVWQKPVEGLLITGGLTLVLVNSLDLSAISVMGSAGFLLIFAAVNLAAFRLRAKIRASGLLTALAAVACLIALGVLTYVRAHTSPLEVLVFPAMVAVSFAIEAIYRATTGRGLHACMRWSRQEDGG